MIFNKELSWYGVKVVLTFLMGPLVQGFVLFEAAGRIKIVDVWIYLIIYSLISIIGVYYIANLAPEVLNHRGEWRKKEGFKQWDKILASILVLLFYIVTPLLIGLDLGRFHWSGWGNNTFLPGLFGFIFGMILLLMAMTENKHFEPFMRIQKDRDHQVVDSGPYAIVRHPGYLGVVLLCISTPLFLGSYVGLISGTLAIALLVLRTSWEDKALMDELAGYSDYAQQTKYKLIPFVW